MQITYLKSCFVRQSKYAHMSEKTKKVDQRSVPISDSMTAAILMRRHHREVENNWLAAAVFRLSPYTSRPPPTHTHPLYYYNSYEQPYKGLKQKTPLFFTTFLFIHWALSNTGLQKSQHWKETGKQLWSVTKHHSISKGKIASTSYEQAQNQQTKCPQKGIKQCWNI